MFGNFSLFKTPFLGRSSVPPSFVSFFVFYIFSYLLLKTVGCFSGCLMSSAGIQKLFCGIYSVFKCSFDEFVREKVFSPSYSSAILAPPLNLFLFVPNFYYFFFKHTAKWKEFYSKPLYTYLLGSTVNILLYLFYYVFIHPSVHLLIHLFWGKDFEVNYRCPYACH